MKNYIIRIKRKIIVCYYKDKEPYRSNRIIRKFNKIGKMLIISGDFLHDFSRGTSALADAFRSLGSAMELKPKVFPVNVNCSKEFNNLHRKISLDVDEENSK